MYFLFLFQFHTIIKSGLAGPTTFQKYHFEKSWIILINTSNPTKGIVFNKGGNIVSGWMKVFQIKENNPQ
jgi:hypothetical protein